MEEKLEVEELYLSGRHKKKAYRFVGRMTAKILVFFLLAISCFIFLGGFFLCGNMLSSGFYIKSLNEVLGDVLYGESRSAAHLIQNCLMEGDVEAAEVCEGRNMDAELVWLNDNGEEKVLWGTWDGYETRLSFSMMLEFKKSDSVKEVWIGGVRMKESSDYLLHIYLDPTFPENDNLQVIAKLVTRLYEARYLLVMITVVCFLVCVLCFLVLMCGAGRRIGREEVVPGVLTGVHLDVLTVGFGLIAIFFIFCILKAEGIIDNELLWLFWEVFGLTVLAVWLTIYCMELALRLKLGRCWRHSLIYVITSWSWKFFCRVTGGIGRLLKGIPTVVMSVGIFLGICLFELIGIILFVRRVESIFGLLWVVEKGFLFLLLLYLALTCKRLLRASRALSEGREDYRVDTSMMFGDFKEHGENLNSLGMGISKAVAERMKSERLKTELITNVSHDLKTPLTSIINYADLIYEESSCKADEEEEQDFLAGRSKIAEYAEVLLRQSRRLKKLLEDLVEASKATTGNLEVNLEPCEAGVLLTQAVGEYQKKMEEKSLELIARQPEDTVKIMADGRHLWRVFDNLLNNICKYAQENTRVYLSVEKREENVQIIFRNMSQYPLDISPEELEERFVRGDKSRHMEGNGLGLSIAKSLVDLQGGRMEIVTDGDLFKVTLTFRII